MFNLDALIGSWYRGKGSDRFKIADPLQMVFSPYDIPTSLIDDMIARNVRPWSVQTISLAAAGEMVMMTPGFHIVIYGHDGSANKAVNTTAYVECFWGQTTQQATGFPLKHARGLSGPFQALYLRWPAQSNVYCDIVVHTGMYTPWIDGESCT